MTTLEPGPILVRAPPSPERTRLLLDHVDDLDPARVALVSASSGSREAARAATRKAGRPAFLGTPGAFAAHALAHALRAWAPSARTLPHAERRRLLREAAVDVERRAKERAGMELRALLKRPYPGGRDGTDLLLDAIAHGKRTGIHPEDFVPHAFPALRDVRGLLDMLQASYEAHKRPNLDDEDLLVLARDVLRKEHAARDAVSGLFDALVVDAAEELMPVEAQILRLAAPSRFVVAHAPGARIAWHPPEDPADAWAEAEAQARPTLERAPHAVEVAQSLLPDAPLEPAAPRPPMPPRAVPAASPAMEARLVTTDVREHLGNGVPGARLGVVHRGHEAPRALLEVFGKSNVTYTTVDAAGGDPLAPEVDLLAAYMSWMADPAFRYDRRDPTHRAILETLLLAHEGVTPDAAERFTDGLARAGRRSPKEALDAALDAAGSPAVAAAWDHLRDHRLELRRNLDAMPIAERARRAALFLRHERVRQGWDSDYLERLARHAGTFERAGDFAESLRRAADGSAVRVLPAEEAKGRVFDHVFVVGVHADAWPRPAPADLPEEDHARWEAREGRLFAYALLAAGKTVTVTGVGPASPLLRAFARAPASMRGARPSR